MHKSLRTLVHLRDENCCRKCGTHYPKRGLQVHHILPQRLGGPNEYFNLMCLCNRCHVAWHKHEAKIDAMWVAHEAIAEYWKWLDCEDWQGCCDDFKEDLWLWSEDYLKELIRSIKKRNKPSQPKRLLRARGS